MIRRPVPPGTELRLDFPGPESGRVAGHDVEILRTIEVKALPTMASVILWYGFSSYIPVVRSMS